MRFLGENLKFYLIIAAFLLISTFLTYISILFYTSYKDEVSNNQLKINQLDQEIEGYKTTIDEMQINVEDLKADLVESKKDIESKEDEIIEKQDIIEHLQEEKESLENDNSDLKNQLEAKKEEDLILVSNDEVHSLEEESEIIEDDWETFVATYYDANYQSTGKNLGDPGYGETASGRYVESGVTIAVDPNVIPLDSWVLIRYPDGSVEKRRADDTGSAINGNKIDIYIENASITSGKHNVEVKVL